MKRQAYGLSALALVAGVSLTFANEGTGSAFAQESASVETAETAEQTTETVFVSQEVVQPLAESAESDAATDQEAAPSANSLRELVAQVETDETLSDQMHCLAGAVYFESRGEPLAGQLAVAQVVVNRADSPRFPASYCDVVYQRAQFSFVKNRSMPKIREASRAWERAKAIALIAHEGLWESEAQDSLYFHAKYVRPKWSRKKVAQATISTHVFYK